ncbi:hypothetical protein [Paenibacillus aestuarii]|uniref:Phage tail protein n=1 Tax=Paenibacillus aestuarii TaxID=516965 RepID=A0ABW0KHC3_9BACL|nr:hypothetical protein [Paenibacillus aestuarii]
MREELVLKHAVGGRTFIQTGKKPLDYTITQEGSNWKISVHLTPEIDIQEILKWKQELNLFLFQEFEDQPTNKIWFYIKNGPVLYNEQIQLLTIVAESKIEYIPSNYSV